MALPLGHDTIVVCCKHEHQKQSVDTLQSLQIFLKKYTQSPLFSYILFLSLNVEKFKFLQCQ